MQESYAFLKPEITQQKVIQIKVPDPEHQKLELERYRSSGQLSPELESSIKADPSAFEHVVQNQKYAQAQDQALSQLQDLGEEGGLNLSDKANLQEQMIANANHDRANRDSISDEFARRGQLGSGMALQAQLGGAQSSGDRDAMMRLKSLGGAQDRALAAIQGAGDLAGKMQGADFERQGAVASARDRINQFNTQNAQSVQMRNIAARNEAQGTNLANQQHLANSNTDIANQQQKYNQGLQQQQFENQMQLGKAKSDVYSGQAGQANQDAGRTSQAWGGAASGLGQLASANQAQSNWDSTKAQNQKNWDDWMKKAKNT